MRYCKNCGARLKDGAIYCYVCGTQYDEHAPEEDAAALRANYRHKIRAEEKRLRARSRNLLLLLALVVIGAMVLVLRFGALPKLHIPEREITLVNSKEQEEKAQREAAESRSSKTRQELQQQVAELKGEVLSRSEDYIAKGYYKEAIELLKLAQTYNQSDLQIQTLLTRATTDYENFVKDQVQIYLENRDWDGAMGLLNRAKADLPDDAVIDQLYTTTDASKTLYQ